MIEEGLIYLIISSIWIYSIWRFLRFYHHGMQLRPQMSSLFPSRCYSEWLIPAPGESYLPSLTEAGIRKRSETISRDARLGPWKFPSIVSLPRYASGKRIPRSNLRPSLSISSKSLRSPSLPVERLWDSIVTNNLKGKQQFSSGTARHLFPLPHSAHTRCPMRVWVAVTPASSSPRPAWRWSWTTGIY